MKPSPIKLTAAVAVVAAPSGALAHGSGTGLYHYLSSPDHVVVSGVLVCAALVAIARILRKPAAARRRGER